MTSGVRRTSAVAAVSAFGLETRVAKTQIRTMSGITIDTINPAVKDMQYAVRGAIVSKAGEIAAALKEDPSKYPFDKIVMCNIGNPQSLGQKPITFYRQVLALCDFPDMLDSKEAETLFPADVRKRARDILDNTKGGTGAYSESKGVAFLREMVAAGIEKRDGHPCDVDDLWLTDGASVGCHYLMKTLIRDANDAMLVPIPQYPLYSATLALYGGTLLPYYLEEEKGWALDVAALKKTCADARASAKRARARGDQPRQPHGRRAGPREPKRGGGVLRGGEPASGRGRGVPGERLRGGQELHVVQEGDARRGREHRAGVAAVHEQRVLRRVRAPRRVHGAQRVRQGGDGPAVQARLRGPVPQPQRADRHGAGHAAPEAGDESYALYKKERDDILASLKRRAATLVDGLNALEGVTCNPAQGAMYAFPKITLPSKHVEEAATSGMAPDALYCMKLLEATGIVVVPGSGFGQQKNTWHFRTTFLPAEADIADVVAKITEFHGKFMDANR